VVFSCNYPKKIRSASIIFFIHLIFGFLEGLKGIFLKLGVFKRKQVKYEFLMSKNSNFNFEVIVDD